MRTQKAVWHCKKQHSVIESLWKSAELGFKTQLSTACRFPYMYNEDNNISLPFSKERWDNVRNALNTVLDITGRTHGFESPFSGDWLLGQKPHAQTFSTTDNSQRGCGKIGCWWIWAFSFWVWKIIVAKVYIRIPIPKTLYINALILTQEI